MGYRYSSRYHFSDMGVTLSALPNYQRFQGVCTRLTKRIMKKPTKKQLDSLRKSADFSHTFKSLTKKKIKAGVIDEKNVHSILKQLQKYSTKRVVKGWAILQGTRMTPPQIEFTRHLKTAKYLKDVEYLVIPATITYHLPPKTI